MAILTTVSKIEHCSAIVLSMLLQPGLVVGGEGGAAASCTRLYFFDDYLTSIFTIYL